MLDWSNLIIKNTFKIKEKKNIKNNIINEGFYGIKTINYGTLNSKISINFDRILKKDIKDYEKKEKKIKSIRKKRVKKIFYTINPNILSTSKTAGVRMGKGQGGNRENKSVIKKGINFFCLNLEKKNVSLKRDFEKLNNLIKLFNFNLFLEYYLKNKLKLNNLVIKKNRNIQMLLNKIQLRTFYIQNLLIEFIFNKLNEFKNEKVVKKKKEMKKIQRRKEKRGKKKIIIREIKQKKKKKINVISNLNKLKILINEEYNKFLLNTNDFFKNERINKLNEFKNEKIVKYFLLILSFLKKSNYTFFSINRRKNELFLLNLFFKIKKKFKIKVKFNKFLI